MKYIFLQSHYGAPYLDALESLRKIPGTWVGHTGKTYDHPSDLLRLQDKWSIRFTDTILENQQVQSYAVENSTFNLYLTGTNDGGKGEDYLRFRMRRMYEVWKRSGGIVLNDEGWDWLEEKFNVRLDRVTAKGGNLWVDKYLAKMGVNKI